jgi:cullin 1
MKSRKTLKHSSLMTEVAQQLMNVFRPDPKAIKRRIEDLITRDYLERDDEDSFTYHYVA